MSDSEKPIHCMIHLYDILGKGKLYKYNKKINDYRSHKGGTGKTQRIFRANSIGVHFALSRTTTEKKYDKKGTKYIYIIFKFYINSKKVQR